MRSFNKVMLLGNMTADPQQKATKTGSEIITFSVATNRDWKNKEGTIINETHFHKVVAFGRLGANIVTYFKKGSPILLSGRLSTRSFTGKEGKLRYSTEIVAEDFNFVPLAKRSNETEPVQLQDEELADELAEKFTLEGAQVEEVIDY